VRNRDHYIATFAWGRLAVRHKRGVIPIVSLTGTAIGLPAPGLAGLPPTPAVAPTATEQLGLAGTTGGDLQTSTVFIPPHAPGTLHVGLVFVDAQDKTAARAETGVDLVVDPGYSGALRFGIASVLHAEDRSYSTLQRVPNGPKEIVEQTATPTELVIGYSLYWDGLFRPQGRTYNLISGSWLARHAGLFVGFGALSFANSNVDFLRSIHVGPELELSRNISIATTFVYRRGTTLAGDLRAGGAAPEGTIPTSTTYSWGAGLVLTLSFDAVKFATNPLASGAGK